MSLPWVAKERFFLALLVAILAHGFLLFGLHFQPAKPVVRSSQLEVTLVTYRSEEKPQKAEFLAPQQQVGEGSEVPSMPIGRPARSVSAKVETEQKEVAPQRIHQKAPAKAKVSRADPQEPRAEPAPRLDALALHQQIAEIGANFNQPPQDTQHRPKFAYINSVNAQRYKAAAYERGWQDKVERIGNLNYPEEARRLNLTGSLLLSVGIRQDGSLYNVQVRRSSGSPLLDEAAQNIVRLSAPFSPFPLELREEAEVLVITRTWKFFSDSRLETSP